MKIPVIDLQRIARAGPWLVSFGPAYFVFDSMVNKLNAPWWIAVPTAIGIELTGVAAFDMALDAFVWNRSKRDKDPTAPLKLALIPMVVYLVSGVILTAVLKNNWMLGLFFALAAAGYATIALQFDQSQRTVQVEQDKNDDSRRRAFWKVVKERGLNREVGEAALLQAEGDPVVALALLPESSEQPEAGFGRSRGHSADNHRPYEYSPEFDELLQKVIERFEHSDGDPFGWETVQDWTGRKRTTAYAVLNYGQQSGVVQQVGRGKYVCANGKEPHDDAIETA
jgi:hypothetical protein